MITLLPRPPGWGGRQNPAYRLIDFKNVRVAEKRPFFVFRPVLFRCLFFTRAAVSAGFRAIFAVAVSFFKPTTIGLQNRGKRLPGKPLLLMALLQKLCLQRNLNH
jgi:hypothetical protein